MRFLDISRLTTLCIITAVAVFGCGKKQKEAELFTVLTSKETGLHFANNLHPTNELNLFKYMYYYNGSGVAVGDFNNDGLIDAFFTANQSQNRLFLNKGNLQFTDVTGAAKIPNDGGWSTGTTVVDINNDGLLDIYICRVGHFLNLHSSNQLLVCKGIKNGVPYYADEAEKYGLNFTGFSTQATFFDYDMDGDLDMFLLNHAINHNSTFAPRDHFINKPDSLSGDRLYRNDDGHFTNVTAQSGIFSSALSYGLGIVVCDINNDGWPDLYIGNDFHENDYLYINQKNGKFSDQINQYLQHTSQFSMGVDAADLNNDAYPEIVSMDMQPYDPYILKRSEGEDAYDLFQMKIGFGYNYQYARNNLQLNRQNGKFSEVGLYSNVFATDWSWASLLVDVNNDGLKDLFVSNGIPKRMNDIDYINYISNQEIQYKISTNSMSQQDMALVEKFPQIKIPNKCYLNHGDMVFQDAEKNIQNNLPTYSNGAAYADFDNDGDIDIIVNNIDEDAMLYQNKTVDKKGSKSIAIQLIGSEKNVHAIGAKLIAFAKNEIRIVEKNVVKGFQSSMETPLYLSLANCQLDSLVLVWPNNTYQKISPDNKAIVKFQSGLPVFNYQTLQKKADASKAMMEDITTQTKFAFEHKENTFVEFNRELLIPHALSTDGPAMAVGDIDGDGLEDVYLGGARNQVSKIFKQLKNGTFAAIAEPSIEADSTYEDVDACFADFNNDGKLDLIVASGGNEFYGQDSQLLPRLYLNKGNGTFEKNASALPPIYITPSCIKTADINGDGWMDIFIGGRAVPFAYGEIPNSYILINNQKGKFEDKTQSLAPGLQQTGLVTNAFWMDFDKNNSPDLILCKEWGGIELWKNQHGKLSLTTLTDKKGWWNFVYPVDIDNDGDIDFVAGNLGLNSRLKASEKEPVRMYYADFDGNGKKEQILTYYVNHKELPFANKAELQKQMPSLKKQYFFAADFAKADLQEIFGKDKLANANKFEANYFANAILLNNGQNSFSTIAMPWNAQLSPLKTAVLTDATKDGIQDIMLAGNYFDNNIQMGRYDADMGGILMYKGKQEWTYQNINGLVLNDQNRKVLPIKIGQKNAFIIARNNQSARIIAYK